MYSRPPDFPNLPHFQGDASDEGIDVTSSVSTPQISLRKGNKMSRRDFVTAASCHSLPERPEGLHLDGQANPCTSRPNPLRTIFASIIPVALISLGIVIVISYSGSRGGSSLEIGQRYVNSGTPIDGPGRTFTPGEGGTFGLFGKTLSVSGSGKRVAVGSPEYSSTGKRSRGLVQVFEQHLGDQWELLTPTFIGDRSGDRTGSSISLSLDGSVLAVGSPDHFEQGERQPLGQTGKVIVYRRTPDNSSWEQYGKTILGRGSWDRMGSSLSVSQDGSRIAIACPGKASNTDHQDDIISTARVFELNSDTNEWVQFGDDLVGVHGGSPLSISADGTVVALGSIFKEDRDGQMPAVRVFKYDSILNKWIERGHGVTFGQSTVGGRTMEPFLSTDGNVLAIGSNSIDTGSKESESSDTHYFFIGKVYSYDNGDDDWIQISDTFTSEGSYPATISMSSDASVVAFSDPNLALGGGIKIFRAENNEWIQLDAGNLRGSSKSDRFGEALSLSSDGSRVVVGAPGRRNPFGQETGRVSVFKLSSIDR